MEFKRTFSGAAWEKKIGYCRAIKAGDTIYVTGTASVAEGGGIFAPGDAYSQTIRSIDIIEKALKDLGADLSCVVLTRMFVTDIKRWEEFGRAHQEKFGEFPPATTILEISELIDPEMLIEFEVIAVCPE